MNIPEDLKYTREHEWLLIEEGTATYGITDYAQSELGDIVFVELPQVGDRTTANEPSGAIEAVKMVADLVAPVAGEVVDVNDRLSDEPEIVNRDPYGEGWMVKVAFSDPSELEELMGASDYRSLVEQERAKA